MIRILAPLVLAISLAGPASASSPPPCATISCAGPIAQWDWDWYGFKKYWAKQLGKTTGVFGVVALVVGAGALIIMSAKKKT